MENFGIKAQNEAIKKAAVDAVQSVFPIEGKLRRVDLQKVWVEDNLDPTDYASQAKAKEKDGTWGAPVYAELKLTDKSTGKTIDEGKVKVFTLPKTTARYSYIVKGSEYQVSTQLRLKPGVYTTRKQNEELKSQVNLAKGKNFDVSMQEDTGVFEITKVGGGAARIPLYPILAHLGISHQAIEKAWGSKVADANRSSDTRAVDKLRQAFGLKAEQTLADYLDSTEISPETTKAVFGKSFDSVSGDLMLNTAKNLLNVHLGKREPDDRNSLEFKEIHGVDDFIKERLEKNKATLAFKVRRGIDNPNRTKLTQIISPGAFNSTVESFFTQDDKSATPEQTNPLEMLSGQYRTTVMGSGGIQSERAVTDEMRNIHPSHFGFIDPIHTPESGRVGVNMHLPLSVVKDGKVLKKIVVDHNRNPIKLTPTEAFNKRIAFPGQDMKSSKLKVMYKGNPETVSKAKVDYFTPADQSMFSWSTNMIPYLESNQGNRASMAAKMMEQAIALKHREAPLVQNIVGKNKTMEQLVGSTLSIEAPDDGVITSVKPGQISMKTKDGVKKVNLYNNFALNRKSFMHNDPKVKVGDKVSKGQLIADSNYTKDGELALGTNMRVAYVPYKSLNFEDGIVITDSAANKLTSEHIYRKTLEMDKNTIIGLSAFQSMYPNALSATNLRKLDKDGVIKEGERVEMGDTVIAALRKRDSSQNIKTIARALSDRPQDISITWPLEDTGIVQSVLQTGGKIVVSIKTEEKAKIGDKLAGRFGNKGVISAIISDNEAPKDKDGKSVDILLNPHGVVSRINIGQIYESAAGKAALKSGKKVVNDNFDGANNFKKVEEILKTHGVEDKEELFDENGKSLGQVHVGNPYILKLFKQSTGNFSVRQGGPGNAYDINRQPLKAGGDDNAKAMDMLTIYSMLSHGARANLREMATTKGDKNDEYWKALKSGQMLPTPNEPFVYQKFLGYLKGAGIDVRKDGSKLTLGPLTDDQVQEMSSGKLQNPLLYRGKDMAPIKGGLFDPKSTGGLKGDKWSHIELAEPVVNPSFENAVKKLTGLGKNYDRIMSGKLFLDDDGKFNSEGKGVTGGHAMEKILKGINIDDQLTTLNVQAKRAKGDKLDQINKKMRYLTNLKDLNLSPDKAYMRKSLPVVPPQFRPVYPLPDGSVGASSVNYLYQNTAILNTMSKLPVMDLLPETEKSDLRKDLYENVKGVTGLTDVNIKGRERQGFISEIKGDQPKRGFFINKMISKKQDYTGRGTIIPDANLGIDEIGMPEQMAWKLFEPFVIKELGRHGKTPLDAQQEIKNKTHLAKRALDVVMKERKVLLNRAPSLHKFSIMAFQPKITDGKSVKIPPLVTKGLNADFDGDCMVGFTLTLVNEQGISFLKEKFTPTFIKERLMTARFKTQLPTMNEKGEVFLFNLEDFPHGELLKSKEGKNGRIDFYKALPGFFALSYDHNTNNLAWKPISYWSKHYKREIEVVTLASGHQIITDDDPRAVYGIPAGSLKTERFTPTNAIERRVWVPRSVRINHASSDGPLNTTLSTDKISLPMTKDFGYLIGAIAANGWVEHCHEEQTGRVHCAIHTPSAIDGYESALKSVLGVEANRQYRKAPKEGDNYYGENTKVWFRNSDFAELMETLVGAGSRNKHLPPSFLNSPLEFREGLFAGLMDNDGSISQNRHGGRAHPQLLANYTSSSIRLIQEVQLLASSLGIRSRITATKTPAGKPFWLLSFSSIDIKSWNGKHMHHTEKLAALNTAVVDGKSATAAKSDLVPISEALAIELRKVLGSGRSASNKSKTIYAILSKSIKTGGMSRNTAREIVGTLPYDEIKDFEDFKAWVAIVENNSVTWDQVKSIEKTGIREDGYDLTVPGYETFMNVDGVILSNTVVLHTPISEEANREATKMLPSNNLFQPGTGKLMTVPTQEAQIGLYYLSQTPQGRQQLSAITGSKYPVTSILTKKSTTELLERMAREMTPQEFAIAVAKFKEAGDNHAYSSGFSLGMEDIADFSKGRDKIVGIVGKAAKRAKTPEQLSKVTNAGAKAADNMIEKKLKGKKNALYDMVESGARGNKDQLRQMLVSPLFVTDFQGKTLPNVISKSYSEGLDAGDYWQSMYGARRGMMDRAIQTSLPGAFSKDIMANTIDNVISTEDCGVKNGKVMPLTSPDVVGRYLAKDQLGIAYNTLVTSQVLADLKKKGAVTLEVRTPLNCLQAKGTCAKCYGIDEHGRDPSVGDNVGAKAGQTIAEPLVQLTMNTFHSGGVAGSAGQTTGYARINQLLKMPQTVVGAAPLAEGAGKVEKIEKGPAGGYYVHMAGKRQFVPKGADLKVRAGSKVNAGDPLSTGVIKPQELVKAKGMQAAQEYITDELHKSYADQGIHIERKVFETIVRSLGNTTQVVNKPKDSNFLPGDVIPYTVANNYNQNLERTLEVSNATGCVLAEDVGPFKKGKTLEAKDLTILQGLGHKTVKILKEEIKHEPFLKGVESLPLLKRDWMAALGYRNLAKALTEGAGQGWSSDLEGYHPVPSLVYGKNFGKGKDGKY